MNRTGMIEFIPTVTRHRARRRPGDHEEVAARAPQAVPDARRAQRRHRAEGRARDGHLRLRQEPRRQGDRVVLRAAALPHRHDRDLLRPARQARGARSSSACHMLESMAPAVVWFDEIEAGDQHAGEGGRARPHLRLLPHLDAGEDARPVRRRDRQPHRPAARRDDPQGPLRRGVLRRPAARRRAARDLPRAPPAARHRLRRRSTSSRSRSSPAAGPAPRSSSASCRR